MLAFLVQNRPIQQAIMPSREKNMSIRTGFIGLGNQGKPIAAHLAPAGFETTVYDIVDEPVAELVAGGAKAAATPREVGSNSDLVGICVPEDKHVKAVTFGEDGLLAGMSAGGVILIHSTILPETAEEVAEAAAAQDIEVMDACVTGGAVRAANRELTFLVGGSEAALEKMRPYAAAISDVPIVHAGALGSGAKLKLCINLVGYLQFAAAYEASLLARAVGLDQKVLEAAGQSNGNITPQMIAYLQSQLLTQEARDSEGYQALMRNHLDIAEKDLAWALQLGRKAGLGLPFGGLVSQSVARLYGVNDPNRR